MMICILSLTLSINSSKIMMTYIIFKIQLLVLESLHNSMINQFNNNLIHRNPHKKYTLIISLIHSHNRHLNLLPQSLIKSYYTVQIQIIRHPLRQFLELHPKLITSSIKDSLPHQKRVNCKAIFYLIYKQLILVRFLFIKLH